MPQHQDGPVRTTSLLLWLGLCPALLLGGCSQRPPAPGAALDGQHARLVYMAKGSAIPVMFSSGPASTPTPQLKQVGKVFDNTELREMGSLVTGFSQFVDSFGRERHRSLASREQIVEADQPFKVSTDVKALYQTYGAQYSLTCHAPTVTLTPRGNHTYLFEFLIEVRGLGNGGCDIKTYELGADGERRLIEHPN